MSYWHDVSNTKIRLKVWKLLEDKRETNGKSANPRSESRRVVFTHTFSESSTYIYMNSVWQSKKLWNAPFPFRYLVRDNLPFLSESFCWQLLLDIGGRHSCSLNVVYNCKNFFFLVISSSWAIVCFHLRSCFHWCCLTFLTNWTSSSAQDEPDGRTLNSGLALKRSSCASANFAPGYTLDIISKIAFLKTNLHYTKWAVCYMHSKHWTSSRCLETTFPKSSNVTPTKSSN